ncbi:hypothetical protein M9Y10_031849 [Tritrichomonas musculus]|uniref:Auto-transporter adhesin head GIN domain-containing protein n=1 Tax=Tritrichomonas musculus TaxID=1915356 RepID=A0ABR2H0R3_9EUKA
MSTTILLIVADWKSISIYENDIPWNSVNIIDVIPIRNGETLNIDDILSKFPKIEESDTTKDYVVSIVSTRQEEITVDLSGIKLAENQYIQMGKNIKTQLDEGRLNVLLNNNSLSTNVSECIENVQIYIKNEKNSPINMSTTSEISAPLSFFVEASSLLIDTVYMNQNGSMKVNIDKRNDSIFGG